MTSGSRSGTSGDGVKAYGKRVRSQRVQSAEVHSCLLFCLLPAFLSALSFLFAPLCPPWLNEIYLTQKCLSKCRKRDCRFNLAGAEYLGVASEIAGRLGIYFAQSAKQAPQQSRFAQLIQAVAVRLHWLPLWIAVRLPLQSALQPRASSWLHSEILPFQDHHNRQDMLCRCSPAGGRAHSRTIHLRVSGLRRQPRPSSASACAENQAVGGECMHAVLESLPTLQLIFALPHTKAPDWL